MVSWRNVGFTRRRRAGPPPGAALLLCGLVALQGCATGQSSPDASKALWAPAALAGVFVTTLGQGCGGHLGSAHGMASWAGENGFVPASAKTLPMYGASADASVWVPPVNGINLAMVFGRDGVSCRVYAQGPDIDLTRSLFVSVLENVRRPGILVEKEVDREVVQGNVRVQQMAFRVRAETSQATRPDRVFILTTNRMTGARFPLVATASLVQGR